MTTRPRVTGPFSAGPLGAWPFGAGPLGAGPFGAGPFGAVLSGAVLSGAVALGLGAALAGCSAGSPGSRVLSAAAGTTCGTTTTGANVPVAIRVASGAVDCGTAMRVEHGYAAAIRSGGLRGNGGGAPVTVDGWTCRTYPTPAALRTGTASECHTASAEVVAVLSLSSASAPARD